MNYIYEILFFKKFFGKSKISIGSTITTIKVNYTTHLNV